ncbi:hypothetical protein [Oceanicola sp. S124]|uniref:hypothetical protein n=1 Tax=Oceanicola sp. S124 TaxID=1042378 RepID=UPI00025589C6|nr:hypothetical protein [Oceanicola sp. S124]
MPIQEGAKPKSALGLSLLAIVLGGVGVVIEQLAAAYVPFLVIIAISFCMGLMFLLCMAYSALPMPRARRLPVAVLGGVINLLVALLVWLTIRLGLDTALETLAGGPGAVWEMMQFLSTMVGFTFKGEDFTGEFLLYAIWLPELALIFLAPVLMSRLELNDLH